MEKALENSAVLAVLRRWMPELHRASVASGKPEETLLEQALSNSLPRTEEVDIPKMIAEAKASGFKRIDDFDQWQAKREDALRKRLSNLS